MPGHRRAKSNRIEIEVLPRLPPTRDTATCRPGLTLASPESVKVFAVDVAENRSACLCHANVRSERRARRVRSSAGLDIR